MTILALAVDVDDDVSGEDWTVSDRIKLIEWIAVITLGQAQHAARIISELELGGPALSYEALYKGARGQLRIRGSTEKKREVSRYHRDGFLFECI